MTTRPRPLARWATASSSDFDVVLHPIAPEDDDTSVAHATFTSVHEGQAPDGEDATSWSLDCSTAPAPAGQDLWLVDRVTPRDGSGHTASSGG